MAKIERADQGISVWFIRCGGESLHGEPGENRYVDGQPRGKYDHTAVCLRLGFARIGWPGSGDLRKPGWEKKARATYSGSELTATRERYLRQFGARVRVGDLVVVPSERGKPYFHLGRVEPAPGRSFDSAYFYRWRWLSVTSSMEQRGDFYENAHRVQVTWAKRGRETAAFRSPDLSGYWRRAFSPVAKDEYKTKIQRLAKRHQLLG